MTIGPAQCAPDPVRAAAGRRHPTQGDSADSHRHGGHGSAAHCRNWQQNRVLSCRSGPRSPRGKKVGLPGSLIRFWPGTMSTHGRSLSPMARATTGHAAPRRYADATGPTVGGRDGRTVVSADQTRGHPRKGEGCSVACGHAGIQATGASEGLGQRTGQTATGKAGSERGSDTWEEEVTTPSTDEDTRLLFATSFDVPFSRPSSPPARLADTRPAGGGPSTTM